MRVSHGSDPYIRRLPTLSLPCIDYIHWIWKNCKFAWQALYKGHIGDAMLCLKLWENIKCVLRTLLLAWRDLAIWYQCAAIFFGVSKTCWRPCSRVQIWDQYTNGYYMADGIYPKWSTFVKTISNLQIRKKLVCQEGCRASIWCARSSFTIVRYPALTWLKE